MYNVHAFFLCGSGRLNEKNGQEPGAKGHCQSLCSETTRGVESGVGGRRCATGGGTGAAGSKRERRDDGRGYAA